MRNVSKRGVLMINVGTPDEPTVESVRSYLREFLLDPDVIDAPYLIRQLLVRGIILRVRPGKVAPLYKKIWMEEGSPLRVYSESTPVLGFLTLNECSSLGEVSKNACIFSNCEFVKLSTN